MIALRRSVFTLLAALGICLAAQAVFALDAPAKPATATSAVSKPSWSELSSAEKIALAPLASRWDGLTPGHKRKWIAASKDFAKLEPAEQAKVHGRMNEWVSLSPTQRANARQNFAEHKALTDGLTPEQRKAQWQAYQQLSPEQKRQLAQNSGKPMVTGAAIAPKPQPVLKKEPTPEFGTAKVLSKAHNTPTPVGKIVVAPHQQQGAILPGNLATSADTDSAKQ